jgi:AcrR family transcriptional regulator
MSARHATQTTLGPPAGRQLGHTRQRAIPRPGRRNAERKSKEQRRDEILDVATAVFAEKGLHGASTEQIAKLAGISQPYVFRLFGTKKQLYLAVVARGFRQTLELMQQAAEGKRGREALAEIDHAYTNLLESNRTYLRAQIQSYGACDDVDICEVVQHGFGDLVTYVERVSGQTRESVAGFFAKGMLLSVLASIRLDNPSEPWAIRLLEGFKEGSGRSPRPQPRNGLRDHHPRPARPRADAAARTVELVGARAAAQIARTDQPQRDTRPQPKRS